MRTPGVDAWVEGVLRRYARQTNRLLAGRSFGIAGDGAHADALEQTLRAIGARVLRVPPGTVADGVDHTFDASPTVEPGTKGDSPLSVHAGAAEREGDSPLSVQPRETPAARIDRAARHMPVVAALAERLAAAGTLDGLRVGLSLVLEPKTAVLALALARTGARVSVHGHPEETDAAVAAELAARGVPVFAGTDPAGADARAEAFLGQRLHLLVDDGSRLTRRLAARPELAAGLIGATEETTSGLRPLRELARLPFPVIAVNDAGSKLCFDNAHGTGQSCLFTILDLVDPAGAGWLAGRSVAVAGFGPVGEGFARHAAALGATVLVADPDPVAELRARFAGYTTGPLTELAAAADLVVSASGHPGTISVPVLDACSEGTVVAVAGGVDGEVALDRVLAAGGELRPVAPKVDDLHLPGGGVVRLLDRGGCINCTAGEGNPIEIMDLSFGVQLAALELLATDPPPPGVQPLPRAADRAVALLALDTWGAGR